MISFLLKHFSCACLFYLLTLCNLSAANASPQADNIEAIGNMKNTKNTKEISAPKAQLSFISEENTPEETKPKAERLNLVIPHNNANNTASDSNSNSNKKTYIDFNKLKPKNRFKQMKERYLTFYSGKAETLRATYLQGSYAINYTQNW